MHILKEDGQPLKELLRQLNSHLRMNLQSVTNTAIMYPLVTDICRESTPEKGLVLSASHLQLMDTVMKFNYQHIYRSKRLEIYHAYARLILESIYSLLKECYAGDGTLDNLRLLQHDYPTLGRHFLERMYKLSDVGRKTALHDKFGNDFGNTVLYRISSTERDYRIACIDYIAGMTDTYAEKIFVEMTTF